MPVTAVLLLPQLDLQDFLTSFSRLLVSQLAPEIPEQRVQVAVAELLGGVGANVPKPVDVRLEFKHVCKCVQNLPQQEQQCGHSCGISSSSSSGSSSGDSGWNFQCNGSMLHHVAADDSS
jgi:hypothetical protein